MGLFVQKLVRHRESCLATADATGKEVEFIRWFGVGRDRVVILSPRNSRHYLHLKKSRRQRHQQKYADETPPRDRVPLCKNMHTTVATPIATVGNSEITVSRDISPNPNQVTHNANGGDTSPLAIPLPPDSAKV